VRPRASLDLPGGRGVACHAWGSPFPTPPQYQDSARDSSDRKAFTPPFPNFTSNDRKKIRKKERGSISRPRARDRERATKRKYREEKLRDTHWSGGGSFKREDFPRRKRGAPGVWVVNCRVEKNSGIQSILSLGKVSGGGGPKNVRTEEARYRLEPVLHGRVRVSRDIERPKEKFDTFWGGFFQGCKRNPYFI